MEATQPVIRYTIEGQTQQVTLFPGSPRTIGSASTCDIQINQGTVAPYHAQIEVREDVILITDLDSDSGTVLDGSPIAINRPVPWPTGSTVTIGEVNFSLDGGRAATHPYSDSLSSQLRTEAEPGAFDGGRVGTPTYNESLNGQIQMEIEPESFFLDDPAVLTVQHQGYDEPTIYLNAVVESDGLAVQISPDQIIARNGVPSQATVSVTKTRQIWAGGRFRVRLTGLTRTHQFDTVQAIVRVRPRYELLSLFVVPFVALLIFFTWPTDILSTPTPTPTPTPPPTAIPSPFPLTPTPPCPGGRSDLAHTVQRGQILFLIARQYSVDVGEVTSANNLTNPDSIEVGQILQIPCGLPGVYPARPPSPPTVTPDLCAGFRLASPLVGMRFGEQDFYWDPAPGATSYRFELRQEGGVLASRNIAAPTTTVTVDTSSPHTGATLFWTVTAFRNSSVICPILRSPDIPREFPMMAD